MENLKISESTKSIQKKNMEVELKEIRPIEIPNMLLSYMVGVIDKVDILRFTRMLFRVTKGNIFSIIEEIKFDDLPLEQRDGKEAKNTTIMKKAFFILMYQAGETGALTNKLMKICDSFGAVR